MSSTQHGMVVVGAGLAGGKAVEALREQGFDGPLTLVGDERHVPYERPPLSKDYLQGKADRSSFDVHPRQWYADHDVDLRLAQSAVALDAAAHVVTVTDGSELPYDRLLLATGSAPRPLTVPGADLDGVHYLRRVEDSEELRAAFVVSRRVVIIGAGWIGLETAAAARAAGADVTLLEMAPLPLVGVLGTEVAQVFADLHRDHGVELMLGVRVESLAEQTGRVVGVHLADGRDIPADLVVVGVGITPNVELAAKAGLAVDDGILVDDHLRTSDADVFAVGDVANAYHPLLHRRIRVEHWANALNQPAVAATNMLGGDATYDRLPYFFSDQYDLGLEYVGHAPRDGYDQVVFRGDVPGREFLAFWLSDGHVLAGMNVNVWDVVDDIKALITSQRAVDVRRLTDPRVALGDV